MTLKESLEGLRDRAKTVLTNRDYWEGYEAAINDAIKLIELQMKS